MNNFNLALGQSWNKYYALNEFLGSFMIVLFAIVFFYLAKKHIKNKYLIAPIIGVTFLAVTMITTVMGHLYGGSSNALALINPIVAIINGVIRNLYIGLGYIIAFEFIGALAGGMLATLIIKGLGGNLKEFTNELPFDDSKMMISFTKETVLNIFLCLCIVTVPMFGWIHSTLDTTMTNLVMAMIITSLLLISTKNGYFMFMLPLSIAMLLLKLIFGSVNKKEVINLFIASIVHISCALIVGAIFYGLIHTGKIYYALI